MDAVIRPQARRPKALIRAAEYCRRCGVRYPLRDRHGTLCGYCRAKAKLPGVYDPPPEPAATPKRQGYAPKVYRHPPELRAVTGE